MLKIYKYYTVLIILFLLTACNPVFDWRVIKTQEGWEAIFPKKPFEKKRIIDLLLENQIRKVEIYRYFCKVENITFIVESAKILNINNSGSTSYLEKKLFESMKENFNISHSKNVNNIKIYDGYIQNNDEDSKQNLKIATLYKVSEEKVVRGVVLSGSKFFNEENAIFFLQSIKQ